MNVQLVSEDGLVVMIFGNYKVVSVKVDYEPDCYEIYKNGEWVADAYSMTDIFTVLNS